ncbi:la protein homolog [Anabrus simplex]|uniref:la protein homolog n=1 Tax=Anabrus simplex TaxID=316456 RepID=UPI0034DD8436
MAEVENNCEAGSEAVDKKEVDKAVTENGEDKKNVASDEPPSDLEKKIIRQIEYYFGDINLPKDKFLREQMKLDDGWIPLDVMLKFKRLSSLTTDIQVIMAALLKSSEKLMEVDVENKKLRRSPDRPLPIQNEDRRKELMSRTVYVKGFPLDVTLDTLLEYFAQFGAIDNVNMRAYRDKEKNTFLFKGSVFVMFNSKEKAEEFVKMESVKYQDTELIKKWQTVYVEEKRKQREEMKQSKIAAGGQKKQEETDQGFRKGSVMHLKGIPGDTEREDIRKKLTDLGAEVAYINYDKGDTESWVRLQGEDSIKDFIEKLNESKFELGGADIEVRALEGEEEATFLEKAKEEMLKRRHRNFKGKKGGRKGGGRGNFHNNRKRKGGATDDEPPEKKEAVA